MDFLSLTDASRLQFAMTAMFHWIFVPLTLGLGFIIAFMETIYVKTGDEFWKRATKYWMKLFAVNFAIGVATGIILEFEFGTNWSNYSWFVGDIFGAPLAIEGIFAFFMESTFFAIMYFGWDKVSKKAHLVSTWLTAFGTNLSAVWILIANAWMQYPVGMKFNLDTARNEMVDFWAVVSSPVAINKIIHTVANGYTLASVVVIGVCGWYLLKKRNFDFSIKSMKVASIFGLISLLVVIATGDKSAYQLAVDEGYSGTLEEYLQLIKEFYIGVGSTYTDVFIDANKKEDIKSPDNFSVTATQENIIVVYPSTNAYMGIPKLNGMAIPVTTSTFTDNDVEYNVLTSVNTYTGTLIITI